MAPVAMATSKRIGIKPRVLVVDDEPATVEAVADLVGRQADCRLLTARNLGDARQVLGREPIDLLVTDLHLPDGNGLELLDALHDAQPLARSIVITGDANMDGAIAALRKGAVDFLPKPFNNEQLLERVRLALRRQATEARGQRRLDKLRDAVRRLNEARKTVSRKVDLLCNDLITAYGDLSRQLDSVRLQEAFRKHLGKAGNLEQLLCHTMDWLLRQLGYCNIAVWLAGEDGRFQLGAYMKYTVAGDQDLIDAMRDGLVPLTVRQGSLHLSSEEAADQLTAVELEHLAGQTVLSANATYLGEALAAVVLFRDGACPFTDTDAATLQVVSPIFAVALAGAVRAGGSEAEESFTPEDDAGEDWKKGRRLFDEDEP